MGEVLSEQAVRQVAKLARLRLTDEQIHIYRRQLEDVLVHLDALRRLEVEDIEPMAHPLTLTNHLQDDVVGPSLPAAIVLGMAPAVEGPWMVAPKVIGEGGG